MVSFSFTIRIVFQWPYLWCPRIFRRLFRYHILFCPLQNTAEMPQTQKKVDVTVPHPISLQWSLLHYHSITFISRIHHITFTVLLLIPSLTTLLTTWPTHKLPILSLLFYLRLNNILPFPPQFNFPIFCLPHKRQWFLSSIAQDPSFLHGYISLGGGAVLLLYFTATELGEGMICQGHTRNE